MGRAGGPGVRARASYRAKARNMTTVGDGDMPRTGDGDMKLCPG